MTAASILKARGWDNFVDVESGFNGIKKTGVKVTEYVCPTTRFSEHSLKEAPAQNRFHIIARLARVAVPQPRPRHRGRRCAQ